MSDEESQPKPTDYDELFPGRFLKAGLFKGRQVLLTITDVDKEKMPQGKGKPDKIRGILSFKESKGLQLVLNSTNGQCIRAMFGRRIPDWIGKRIMFAPEKDKFGRDDVDAIRIVGSPDISESMTITIDLGPKKKPKTRRLEALKLTQPAEPNGEEGQAAE